MSLVLGSMAILAFVALIVIMGVVAISKITHSRGKHGTSGSISSAALEIQSLLEPQKKRAVETMRKDAEREDEDAHGGI